MQATSDEVLISRIAAGDRLAMQVLYARHNVKVLLVCAASGEQCDHGRGSDQRGLPRRVAPGLALRGEVRGLDLAAGDRRFKALSALRRRSEEELEEEDAGSIADGADDHEVAVQKKDKSEIMRHCLTRLTPEHRDIIDLVYYHEKSVEEVVEIVGIPEATVKTRMFYARKKLSELLKDSGVDRGWP